MTRTHLLKLPPPATVAIYLACYLALDWATYIPEFSPLGITPWNPPVGLALGLVLLKGPGYAPLLALSPFLGDMLVRHVPLPWWVAVLEAALIGAGYAAALAYLRRRALQLDASLRSLSDLIQFVAVAIVGAAAVAAGYAGALVLAGLLPPADFIASALRYWVGDLIGITVVTPFVLILLTHERLPHLGWEAALQALAILAAISIVLGIGVRYQSQLFYLLFLPIVWVAVRSGLEGVSAALVLMQVGIMMALHWGRPASVDVTDFQAAMLILVFAGLAIGMLTSERARVEHRIRLQQDAMARAARIGSMGSLTATLAHEVNQPLTAIANYSRVALRMLDGAPAASEARNAISKVIAQVDRANGVIRRVRDFITVGRTETAPHALDRLVAGTLELLEHEIESRRVTVAVDIPRGLPQVDVDAIQIQQVLTNLIKNALEAMAEHPRSTPRIEIAAHRAGGGRIEVLVRDWGPGLPHDYRLEPLTPSLSEKPEGLGIGLILSQTIVEAHGGTLTIENADPGAIARFTIRTVEGAHDDQPG